MRVGETCFKRRGQKSREKRSEKVYPYCLLALSGDTIKNSTVVSGNSTHVLLFFDRYKYRIIYDGNISGRKLENNKLFLRTLLTRNVRE